MDWQPIATAPFGRELQLAVIDATGTHALVFPCLRLLRGWESAKTHARVNVFPTHWRAWDDLDTAQAPENTPRPGIRRAILLQHLGSAEQHAAQGKRHIARQEELIARLDRAGHDTAEALKVLATLRVTQDLHERDIERLLNELKARGYD